jgi:hypothetical protein
MVVTMSAYVGDMALTDSATARLYERSGFAGRGGAIGFAWASPDGCSPAAGDKSG